MARPWLFDLGAFLYGVMTAQQTWRSSCARLASFFPRHDGAARPIKVLDLGCGPGVSTITLAQADPEATIVGLDLAPRMLDQARQYTSRAQLNHRVSYVQADALMLPFADSSWDMVTGHSFLYLVPDRARAVQEAFRVLRPGGRAASMEPRARAQVLSVVRRRWRETRYLISVLLWRPYSRWHGQFTCDSFRELLRSAGFVRVETELVQDGLGIIGSGDKP